ncbi:MAG TPA: sensor histidine kinase [Armatimonadota bacterium]|jgi:signal transduction histidine kinase
MNASQRIDRIFLLHIWACVPFAPLWLVYGAAAPDPAVLPVLQGVAAFVGVYLSVRTFVVFRGIEIGQWSLLWPVVDIAVVTAILIALRDAQDPTGFLYLLAIAYAALKLPPRSAFALVGLAIAGQLAAGVYSRQWLETVAEAPPTGHNLEAVIFRHFFLLLMGSLIYFLRRENQRVAEALALSEYQRDLSAEMHDGIQHDLVLISRRLDLADAVAAHDPERAVAIAVEQRDVARRASDELRILVRQLRPDATQTDFEAGLRAHLTTLSQRHDIPVELECSGDCAGFPAAYQHPALRIIQEAITNAVKHAQPRRIRVRLMRGPARWRVIIDDDGIGFDASTTPSGFGLESMRARAEKLDGRCRVISRPGAGTRVSVRLPLVPVERRSWFHGSHPRAAHRG